MRRAETGAWLLAGALALACPAGRAMGQQEQESPAVMRAYDLEGAGRHREAAALFRGALRDRPSAGALLGLERTYAELRISDSLLPVLDTLIASRPADPLYRGVQLRTLQILRRDDALRAAFERWAREVPRDPAPYREYARVLIAMGRPALADSVVQRGRASIGSGGEGELAFETAQLRAAQGQWYASAVAWRTALAGSPYLATAAAHALAPAPERVRDSLRALFLDRVLLGQRSALAELELGWGRAADAWESLRVVPADTATAAVWAEFGERALADERYGIARAALAAAIAVRRTPALAERAALAALRGGAPADVISLLPLAEAEDNPEVLARDYLPLHVAALAALGRPSDAEALVRRHDRALTPGQRERLVRELAGAYVRVGDLTRARATLGTGPEADSSEVAGWLALYEGRLGEARVLLRPARDPSPALALALGLVARTRGSEGTALGAAFLALARGDTASAAARFIDAAERHPEASAAMLLQAARLHHARRERPQAEALWSRIVSTYEGSAEAAEAELEWARELRRAGDVRSAIAHLEHLILSAPQSALLPQARRELELARATVPAP